MKLLRLGKAGHEVPAALDDNGIYRDLRGHIDDITPDVMALDRLEALKAIDLSRLPEIPHGGRIACPVSDVPNFFCVGLNYARHADETGMARPTEPILFSKASSALSAPNDDVMIPQGSTKSDWEVELGVVIGREASHVTEADALSYVAGYCAINDLSEREFQIERGGQWIKGKSAAGFGPVGPWIATADEIKDPQNLALWCELNGEMRQNSRTDDMIFSVAEIISYMSRFMTLRVGDIIATGTPEGVGMGQSPQVFLRSGDVLRLGVEGLGEQTQRFRQAPA
ncbi:MAG: fumarylacetoacetate hydrolase family protein [Alphaproteobacteria bacterium]|nr:fumarylacetoacetate hydrolase family protein [Alphaproteobacteria bacterium]